MAAAGDPIVSTDITTIEDYTIRKPLVRLLQAVSQSIPNNTDTALTFTTEEIDTNGFHDTTTNNTRITPNVAGYYRINSAVFTQSFSTASQINLYIAKNGVLQSPRVRTIPVAVAAGKTFATTAILAANGTTDYFEMLFQQSTGGALATQIGGSGFTSVFECEFLRPL